MSDWNTLHLFDSKKFYENIVPKLNSGGQLLDKYINSKLYKYITLNYKIEDETLYKVKLFLQKFDDNFKSHLDLFEVEKREKKTDERYEDFFKNKNHKRENFQRKYSDEIYIYTTVLPLILFSECAQFNPHLILGRRILRNNISAIKGSVAEECINKITAKGIGGLDNDVGHVLNWLTSQEVKLLWLDINSIYFEKEESAQYFHDFIFILKIAVENELGLISISNVREDILKMIEKPKLDLKIDLKKMKLINVIEYK